MLRSLEENGITEICAKSRAKKDIIIIIRKKDLLAILPTG